MGTLGKWVRFFVSSVRSDIHAWELAHSQLIPDAAPDGALNSLFLDLQRFHPYGASIWFRDDLSIGHSISPDSINQCPPTFGVIRCIQRPKGPIFPQPRSKAWVAMSFETAA